LGPEKYEDTSAANLFARQFPPPCQETGLQGLETTENKNKEILRKGKKRKSYSAIVPPRERHSWHTLTGGRGIADPEHGDMMGRNIACR